MTRVLASQVIKKWTDFIDEASGSEGNILMPLNNHKKKACRYKRRLGNPNELGGIFLEFFESISGIVIYWQ